MGVGTVGGGNIEDNFYNHLKGSRKVQLVKPAIIIFFHINENYSIIPLLLKSDLVEVCHLQYFIQCIS